MMVVFILVETSIMSWALQGGGLFYDIEIQAPVKIA